MGFDRVAHPEHISFVSEEVVEETRYRQQTRGLGEDLERTWRGLGEEKRATSD
jgi:hypothetical protein